MPLAQPRRGRRLTETGHERLPPIIDVEHVARDGKLKLSNRRGRAQQLRRMGVGCETDQWRHEGADLDAGDVTFEPLFHRELLEPLRLHSWKAGKEP